ncbi:MAG: hypothetical protein Q7S00_04180 [bacterium]|nr:hypothetical protein [bacterium]
MKRIVWCVATGFGLGLLPAAGTFGSLWGILLLYLFQGLSPFSLAITLIAFYFLAVFFAGEAEKEL